MNTLITPAQAVASAFTDGQYLAPEAIGEGDIAAADAYIVNHWTGIPRYRSQASRPASRLNTSQPR